VIILLDRKYI